MRTTLTIDDHLLSEAKAVAARTHRTIGSVFEDALRQMLARADDPRSPTGAVSLPSDGGSGLQPGVDLENKDQIAQLVGDEDNHAPA
ncbi:MAG TPA: type II toxin-antitoxin system VapB family antitoxin [Dermatophilaceae bacterium]|jgi:hypothetical protein